MSKLRTLLAILLLASAAGADEIESNELTVMADTRDYSLTVESAYGSPTPGVGTHTSYCLGSTVTCTVAVAVTEAGTNWVCSGWTGTGSVPPSGSSASTGLLTLTDLCSTVTWQWQEAPRHTVTLHPGNDGYIVEANSGEDYVVSLYDGSAFPTVHVFSSDPCKRFAGWSPPTPATVNQDFTAQATYEQILLTLSVVSPYGEPWDTYPSTGEHHYPIFTNVYCFGPSQPITVGSTQYVCTGWSLVGNHATSLGPTSFRMSITNHAALTWLWKTRYRLSASAGTGGSVSPTTQWRDAGTMANVTATVGAGYSFDYWALDGRRAPGASTSRSYGMPMNTAHTLKAYFVAPPTEALSGFALWAYQRGLTGAASALFLQDRDHDDLPNGL